jgi:hypothetical protein
VFVRKYLLFGLVLVLAGCGAAARQPAAPSPAAAPPSPTSSAVPSVAPRKDLSTLLPTDAELSALGVQSDGTPVPYLISENSPLVLVMACDGQHPWDLQAKEGLHAFWLPGHGDRAKQFIARYEGISGADVVTGIKKALSCGTVTSDDLSFTLAGEVPLPKVAGADNQYAFCGKVPHGVNLSHCYLLLSSGDKATVFSQGGTEKGSIAQTSKLFASIAPAFATALSRS